MKSDSPLSKIPSLEELLSHPAVAGVVKRVNQTTVAQRAAGFLEEIRSNISQRLDQKGISSVGQLAERLARRLLGPPESIVQCVNATGVLVGPHWPSVPLAEPAIDEVVRMASEYSQHQGSLYDQVETLLKESTTAGHVAIFSTYETAARLATPMEDEHPASRYAGLKNPAALGLFDFPSLNELLEKKSTIAVAGNGLLGGPACGIVLSREPLSLPPELSSPEHRAHDFVLLALMATLKLVHTDDHFVHKVPVWQLLTTPLDNLKQRSERIATLMSENSLVQSAVPVRLESTWCETEREKLTTASWGIEIVPQQEKLSELVAGFAEYVPRIVPQSQQGRILLDLRSVFPRWDHAILKAVPTEGR